MCVRHLTYVQGQVVYQTLSTSGAQAMVIASTRGNNCLAAWENEHIHHYIYFV